MFILLPVFGEILCAFSDPHAFRVVSAFEAIVGYLCVRTVYSLGFVERAHVLALWFVLVGIVHRLDKGVANECLPGMVAALCVLVDSDLPS